MNAELFNPFAHLEPYERLFASAERVASQWLLSHFSSLNADTFDPDNLDPNKPPPLTRMPNLNDLAEYATSLRRLIFARTRFIRTVPDTDDLASLRETNLAALKNLGAIQALTEYLLNTYLTQKLNNIAELEMKEFSKFTLILPRLAASRHGLVHAHLATLTPNKPKPPPGSAGVWPAHFTDQQKSSKRTSPWERQSPDWRESNSQPSLTPFPSPNPNPSVSVPAGPCTPALSFVEGSVSDELTRPSSSNVAQPPPPAHLAEKLLSAPASISAKGAPHTSLGQASNASAGPGPDPTNPKRQRRVPSDQISHPIQTPDPSDPTDPTDLPQKAINPVEWGQSIIESILAELPPQLRALLPDGVEHFTADQFQQLADDILRMAEAPNPKLPIQNSNALHSPPPEISFDLHPSHSPPQPTPAGQTHAGL